MTVANLPISVSLRNFTRKSDCEMLRETAKYPKATYHIQRASVGM